MAQVFYWQDIVGGGEIFTDYMHEIRQLMAGNYASLSLEKLRGSIRPPIYSIRVNDDTRLLFTTYENKVCLLDVVLNHDYHKSRFLRKPAVLRAFLKKRGDTEVAQAASDNAGSGTGRAEQSFDVMNWSDLTDLTITADDTAEFTPLEYYQQRLIRFSAEQASALSAQLPSIVYGPAGSGKSSVALSLLSQYVREHHDSAVDAFPVVYVSRSRPLVDEMKRLWLEMNPEGVSSDGVVFKTYDELLVEQAGVDVEHIVDEQEFYAWYGTTYAELTRHTVRAGVGSTKGSRLEEKLVWQEFRIRSGYADDNEYIHLGARQSAHDESSRQRICAAYHAYQSHLEEMGIVSPSLHSFSAGSGYQLVVVDEAQDLSYGQLEGLNKFSKGSVLYLLGDHQVLFDGKSRLNYLREMFHKNKQKPSMVALRATYRCSEHVSCVANALIQLKYNVTRGSSDGFEAPKLEVAEGHLGKGEAVWLDLGNAEEIAALRAEAAHADFAVVTSVEYIAEAKHIFDTPSVHTPESAKGLEYQTVVFWRPFDREDARTASSKVDVTTLATQISHRAKAGNGDESHLGFFNELITAVTRARKKLVFVQSDAYATKSIQDFLKPHFSDTAVHRSNALPVDWRAWEAEAKRLLRVRNVAQAHDIFINKLGRSEAEFIAFSDEHTPMSFSTGPGSSGAGAGTSAGRVTSIPKSMFEGSLYCDYTSELETLRALVDSSNNSTIIRQIKKGTCFTRLINALKNDGRDGGIDTTLLYLLVKVPEHLSLLCQLKAQLPTLFQQIPNKAWYETVRTGQEKNTSPFLLLASYPQGCKFLKMLFEDKSNRELVDSWVTTMAEHGAHLTLVANLTASDEGRAVIKCLLINYPKVAAAIPADVWVRCFTESSSGLALFNDLATNLPDRLKKIIAFRPEQAAILGAHVNKSMNDYDGPPMLLALEHKYMALLPILRTLGADLNKGPSNGLTPALVAKVSAEHTPFCSSEVTGSVGAGACTSAAHVTSIPKSIIEGTIYYDYTSELETLRTLMDSSNNSTIIRQIKNGTCFTRLMTALKNDGRDGVDATLLYQLVKTPEHLSLLRKFKAKHPMLFKQIPKKAWYEVVHAGKDKNTSPLFWLASYPQGCKFLKMLFEDKSNRELVDSWVTTMAEHGTHNTLVANLIASDEGHAVIKYLLINYFEIAAAIPADVWVRCLTESSSGLALFNDLATTLPDRLKKIITVRPEQAAILGAYVNKPMHDYIEPPLLFAVKQKYMALLPVLHTLGANLNYELSKGTTSVDIAVAKDDAKLLNVLANLGADLDKKSSNGVTPAIDAALNGRAKALKVLGDFGVDLNQIGPHGYSLAYTAVHNGHAEVLKVLAKSGRVDLNQTGPGDESLAYVAAYRGHAEALKVLAQFGRVALNQIGPNGYSLAYVAAENGHLSVVIFLKEYLGSLIVPTILTRESLMLLCAEKTTEVRIRMESKIKESLLLHGDESKIILLPLDIAWIMGHQDIVNILRSEPTVISVASSLTQHGLFPTSAAELDEKALLPVLSPKRS